MINIELNSTEVQAAFRLLAKRIDNPKPALQDAGEYLVESTKKRGAQKKAPDGTPWADNAPSTVARKGRNDPLVGESKRLLREIHYLVAGNDSLLVGSSMEYAALQHHGASKGAFGKTARGAPIPWGDIPARPILGLSSEDETNVLAIFGEYLDPE